WKTCWNCLGYRILDVSRDVLKTSSHECRVNLYADRNSSLLSSAAFTAETRT
ncbi:major facilitator superfamily transporter, partial [Moniliophthora roreri]